MRVYHNKAFRLQLNVLIMPVAEKLNNEAKPTREYNAIFQKQKFRLWPGS